MTVVAILGLARSGKDTAADVLVQDFGFRRFALADRMRRFVCDLDPEASWEQMVDGGPRKEKRRSFMTGLSDLIHAHFEGSPLADAMIRDILVSDADRVVIPDIRFSHQLFRIFDRFQNEGMFQLWGVVRGQLPPSPAPNWHATETELWYMLRLMRLDELIKNASSIGDFRRHVANVAKRHSLDNA